MKNMQQQVGLQEAYDRLVERITTLEKQVVIHHLRDDITQNFLLIHVLHHSSAQELKDAWDKLLSTGFENKIINKYKSMDATVSALIEKAIKESIEQWCAFVDLAVKAEAAVNEKKI
ncbi:hypothetical protein ACKLKO_02995 [Klebsiella variicola]